MRFLLSLSFVAKAAAAGAGSCGGRYRCDHHTGAGSAVIQKGGHITLLRKCE